MVYWLIFITFFKIGLFSFGGGYATLPLIERDLVLNRAWLTAEEFSRLVSISQTTPGPIGINSATFAGYTTAGFWGSLTATLSLCLPSLLIIFALYQLLKRVTQKKTEFTHAVFRYMRPVVVALVATAVYSVGKGGFTNLGSWLIALISFGLVIFSEGNIIPIILTFGLVGILLY
ncbi:MAG: chromate transporter [bacterium (Candidatus Ratteibacteria) CG23_combo_of_CG06-09_8_20_14_all_48_7]|uniref:Chromate transporter n=1 Tax=bacterium (Candidatus Ratteibacteria) CG23_combo_of_CG06-09_8_20_14_all_48_7 TaxID=2014292 RepID=A0A2G9YAC2_9BACT|nr:MAG: chromate transporter [bacterium (Candidatus Ratteibacteria) CG23_combo_of_CG06-09_8_20_14_all_48_7]